jgi:hypothetical protein
MHPRPPLFAGVYRIELLPLAPGWANIADNYFVRQMSKSPCGRCGYVPKESTAGAGLDQNYCNRQFAVREPAAVHQGHEKAAEGVAASSAAQNGCP